MASEPVVDADEQGGDPAKAKPTMKFSINKSKAALRPPKRVADSKDEDDGREAITAVDSDGLVTKNGSASGGPKIIPALENSWKPQKKMKNLPEIDDLAGGPENRFDMDAPAALPGGTEDENGEAEDGIKYGLSVRKAPIADVADDRASDKPLIDREAQKLREDLETLPDVATEEDYDSMPVEDFGLALLRGMGWEKGKPIGRNAKGLVEPVEFVPRQGRLGLGATPKMVAKEEKKYIKPGDSREAKPDLVAPVGPDGKVRHVKGISEKLVERDLPGPRKGKVMRIVGGRHAGLKAEVMEVMGGGEEKGGGQVRMRLAVSEEEVVVEVEDVVDVGSWQEEEALKKREGAEEGSKRAGRSGRGGDPGREVSRGSARDDAMQEGRRAKDTQDERDRHNGSRREQDFGGGREQHHEKGSGKAERAEVREAVHQKSKSKSDRDERGGADGSGVKAPAAKPWLMPHVRVRIVDKRVKGGRIYLKKGTIVDVVTPTVCDVLLDSSESRGRGHLVQGLKQSDLETALPKRGGRVAIVAGRHRGQVGKLLERRSEDELAVVQLAESFDILKLHMDDVAEYVGEMGVEEG